MFCENCGAKLEENAAVCTQCGAPIMSNASNSKINLSKEKPKNTEPEKVCANCGAPMGANDTICSHCGIPVSESSNASTGWNNNASESFMPKKFCKNCGSQMGENDSICSRCGFAFGAGNSFCQNCGSSVQIGQAVCVNCRSSLNTNQNTNSNSANAGVKSSKSKIAAGILGIFLGSLGIHNFYLGYTKKAVIQLCITLISCGMLSIVSAIWGLIEGVFILASHEGYTTDAEGKELID